MLLASADSRAMTLSALIAEILDAFAGDRRIELPHAKGPSTAALRELARVGNNVNQIAHQAQLMRLHLLEAEARRCLASVNAAIDRL
jgi:hypothetical protein